MNQDIEETIYDSLDEFAQEKGGRLEIDARVMMYLRNLIFTFGITKEKRTEYLSYYDGMVKIYAQL